MIKINLLPIKKLRKRVQNRNHFFAYIGAIAIVLVFVAALTGLLTTKINTRKGEKERLIKEKASHDATIKLINGIKANKEVLETKVQAIRTLKKGSQLAVQLLDEIATVIPTERMWINTLDISNDVLSLTGIALDNTTIADYMNLMDESSFFSDANLAGTQQVDVSGRKLKSFSIKFKIDHPEEINEAKPGN